MKAPFFSSFLPTPVNVSLLILAIQVGVTWHHIIVLICTSLMNNVVEHLFKCLLTICISSLAYLSFCCRVVSILYIFWTLDLYQIYDLQIFIPVPYFVHFLDSVL